MKRDWESIRDRYICTDMGYKALEEEFGVSRYTIKERAKREDWQRLRREAQSGDAGVRAERVAAKLLRRMEAAIDEKTEMDSKEIKAMTAALKELRELSKSTQSGAEENGRAIEVRFIGETEALSG